MTNQNLILIRHGTRWGLDETLVRRIAKEVLQRRGFSKGVELSLYFVGRDKARKLNRFYRKMEYVPQVLGFPMSIDSDVDGKVRLGDIVICTQKLKYEIKYQKSDLEEILKNWLEHGLDNLLKNN